MFLNSLKSKIDTFPVHFSLKHFDKKKMLHIHQVSVAFLSINNARAFPK